MMRVFVMLLSLALDLTLGDPPNRFHPLMLMGRWLHRGTQAGPGTPSILVRGGVDVSRGGPVCPPVLAGGARPAAG